MDLFAKFKDFIHAEKLFQPGDHLLLAVSGGVDSVALCELCRAAGYSFSIAHCNFKLRGADSDRDAAFVEQLAGQYAVPFYFKSFDTAKRATERRQSIEEAARELRYQWFYELLGKEAGITLQPQSPDTKKPIWIVTAHHADDNVETVVMNFFRGTGIAGLRGMLPKQDKIVRPLLFSRKSELVDYVQSNGLNHVTDATNAIDDYTRNFFRNTVLPLVSKTYPRCSENILKNIGRFRDVALIYDQSVALHKRRLLEYKGTEVHIPVLKLLKLEPRQTILFEILKEFGFTARQAAEALPLLSASSGKFIQSASHRLLKNRDWLILSPHGNPEGEHVLIEAMDVPIYFRDGVITLSERQKEGYSLQADASVAQVDRELIRFPLLLRPWKKGDYFYPLGMKKKKKLSRFFVDQKLSLLQKEHVWVVEMDKKIVWVVGMRIDERFRVSERTGNICLIKFSRAAGN